MKINLYELFDLADIDDLSNLPSQSLAVEHSEDFDEKITANVLTQIKQPKRIGKIIALVAVAAIFISSISVFGSTYLKPDNDEKTFFEIMDGVDLDAVGKELNISSTKNGLTFVLHQVLSDNSRMFLYFICPKYKGYTTEPRDITICVNGERIMPLSVGVGGTIENISWVCISGIKNMSDDMDIQIIFDKFAYVNDDGWVKETRVVAPWSFEFKSFGDDVSKHLIIEPFIYNNETIQPTDFVISPLGFNFDFYISDEELNDVPEEFDNVPIEIEMKDGTVISEPKGIYPCISSNGYFEYEISGEFETFINTDEIKTIKVFESVIYS